MKLKRQHKGAFIQGIFLFLILAIIGFTYIRYRWLQAQDSEIDTILLANSELETSNDFTLAGEEWFDPNNVIKQSFLKGEIIVAELVSDQWGTGLSTLIPIKGAGSEELIAVFGMGYNAKLLNRALLSNVLQPVIITIVLLLFIFLLIIIIYKNIYLRKETTSRLKTSLALKQNEEHYYNLFKNMLNGFALCKIIFDKKNHASDFIFIEVNKAFELQTGLKEINGKKITEVLPSIHETDSELINKFGQIAATGEPATFEIYFNSLRIWLKISAYSPQQEYVVAIFDVITSRKNEEEEMKQNLFRVNALLELNKLKYRDLNNVYVFMLDKMVEMYHCEAGFLGLVDESGNNADIFVSSRQAGVLSWPQKHCINFNWDGYDIWAEVIKKRSNVINNYLTNDSPEVNSLPNKLVPLANYVGIPLIDNDRVVAILLLCNKPGGSSNSDTVQPGLMLEGLWNFVKEQQYKHELTTTREKAIESDILKTAFLQNMSHEVRTPLNAIIGFSELLNDNYNDREKFEYYTSVINQRGKDLLQIISDILDLARIESGQLPITFEECNLNALFIDLSYVFKEHSKRICKEHVDFKVNVNSAIAKQMILTDARKLKQVLFNLTSNAFKFTEQGKIECGCYDDDKGNMIFYVSDTGIGIVPDKHKMIFDRFTQVDQSQTRLYGGTGLGLSIAKGLVKLLHGNIWLESHTGKGTTFYFTIEYKTTQAMPKEPFFILEPEEFYFTDKTVLIVEDDPDNAEFLKEILANKGLIILHTGFGKEAAKIALEQKIDMILMDINLPDMDGYQVTRIVKQQKPEIKIIAQTAYAAQRDRQSAMDAGCDDYMSKPLKYESLLKMMKKYL